MTHEEIHKETTTPLRPYDETDFSKIENSIYQGSPTIKSKPLVAWFALTDRCNLSCAHCSKTENMNDDVSSGMMHRIDVEVLPNLYRILLQASETLLAKPLNAFLDILKAHGVKADILTNGTTLTKPLINKLLEMDVDIRISIEGITEETYQRVRGVKLSHLIKALTLLRDERIRLKSDSKFTLLMTIFYDNIRELPLIIEKASEFKIDYVDVHHLYPSFSGQIAQSLSFFQDLTNTTFLEATKIAKELGIKLKLPPAFPAPVPIDVGKTSISSNNKKRNKCVHPWVTCMIGMGGIVTPCCSSSLVLGNPRTESLDDIWNGPKYQLLRRTVNSDSPQGQCKACAAVPGRCNTDWLAILNNATKTKPVEMTKKARIDGVSLFDYIKIRLNNLLSI